MVFFHHLLQRRAGSFLRIRQLEDDNEDPFRPGLQGSWLRVSGVQLDG